MQRFSVSRQHTIFFFSCQIKRIHCDFPSLHRTNHFLTELTRHHAQLSRIRLIMQNQPYTRSVLNPTATSFTVRARPSSFSTFAPGQRQDAVPHEEAWTQYDGLGPVPRDLRLDRNWRQAVPPGRGQQSGYGRGSSQGRGGNHQQQQRGEPASKRPKQTQTVRNAKTQNAKVGGRSSVRSSGEIIDEAYLAKNYPPLKKEDYPNATKSIFNNPRSFFWDTKRGSARSTFVSHRGNLYQCTVFIKLTDGSEIEAIGDATNKVCFTHE